VTLKVKGQGEIVVKAKLPDPTVVDDNAQVETEVLSDSLTGEARPVVERYLLDLAAYTEELAGSDALSKLTGCQIM
jgi:hypothetical protein